MKTAICQTILLIFVISGCSSQSVSRYEKQAGGEKADYPLIPLKTLLAPEEYLAPRLSPDGKWLSFIKPLDGVPNFFVAPADEPKAAKPVTQYTERGVQAADVSGVVMYRWHADSRHIIYPMDYDGDENWDIYIANIEDGKNRNLTPAEGTKIQILTYSDQYPNEALITVNEIHPMIPSVYRLNLETGERTLVYKNEEGFLGFIPDHSLRLRLAIRLNPAGGMDVLRHTTDGNWEPLYVIQEEDMPALISSSAQKIINVDKKNENLFLYDNEGRNTGALVSLNFETGERTLVASDERVDIGGVLYHPTEHSVQAYATNWTRKRWHVLDESIAADLAFLGTVDEGDWDIVSRSGDDNRWVVRYTLSHEPVVFYLYERDKRQTTRLFTSTPVLEGLKLSKLHPYVVRTDDGFDLVSYIMLPPWADTDDDGRPEQPLPVVMLVHGGPSDERAVFGFGPFLHWLANRGYASLYVNFRGSPGFGKAFMNAQRLEWGGKMHQDLLDQVDWAIQEGIAQRDKVAIIGGSYGGYATLVGMTMTPDVFACGVDLVGPSNLEIFMPHWDEDRMGTVIGDPRTPEGRALLRSRSPVNFAHQTRNPVLIGQGVNDSRVPQEQSDIVVEAMRKNGVKVTYALYPDEGHGLYRTENNYSFWAMTEVFLAQCLGGRYQPITDELEGASVEVPVGAEFIPGLTEALQRRDLSQP